MLMKWQMRWWTRAVPLSKNLSFLGKEVWIVGYTEAERPIKHF